MHSYSFPRLTWLPVVAYAFLAISAPLMADDRKGSDSPDADLIHPDYQIQGEYRGAGLGMQVIAMGDSEFEFAIFTGGLPGAGWNGSPPQRSEGDAELVVEMAKRRGLARCDRSSPTLGMKPPAEALVLFDGSQASLDRHWEKGAKRTDEGWLQPGATTKESFRDYSLHLEFRTPFQPTARGQGRGNSGVYHQGRYETQILDSFGLEGKNNEAGGIYEVRDPDLNACFPPLTWQTYDIDFTAPRFDATGKKRADAVLTVRLNGIVVQREVPVSQATRAAPLQESDSPGPIYLQDHGNPVRFRNIWVVPRDADREALRPIIPGFERFASEPKIAGRVLISQLACAACHATDDELLSPRVAPNLDRVADRLRPDALTSIIAQPHRVKPGTAMPDLLHRLEAETRTRTALAIASFLASSSQLDDPPGDSAAAQRGETLYETIGCIACHPPQRGNERFAGTSIPLGDLTAKYTLAGLSSFLEKPLSIRPSGSMPSLVNSEAEARDIACYLLGDAIIVPGAEQFDVSIYHGDWDQLPDFDSEKIVKRGVSRGLDLSIAGKKDRFGLRFDSFFPVRLSGDYTFYLGSDDGSRLLIDGREIIKVDAIHPYQVEKHQLHLDVGSHSLRVEYFEGGGSERLTLEVEGPEISKGNIVRFVTTDPQGMAKKELIASQFKPDPQLVEEGRTRFQQIGCANCHVRHEEEKPLEGKLRARPLDQLRSGKGCLASQVEPGLPDYQLTRNQREAIEAVLINQGKPVDDETFVMTQLASKNCIACHTRGTVIGPEPARDKRFLTTMQEMGNEGRVPPPLTNVGDKLRPEVLDRIIANGAKDRPYLLTRMPGFGPNNLVGLRERLVRLDQRDSSMPLVDHDFKSDEGKELIVAGRKLAGNAGLACIKCHRFGDKSTPGIEAIDLLKMPERLRQDWFRRYLLAPNEYRPGTRMPLSFPDGKSVLTSIFEGDAHRQIDALWLFLSQGKSAKKPTGLDVESIILAPDARPVLYRNFIEGLSPRGIGVGYPERVNIAWDAERMCLALVWKNDFIDAGKHWSGRGAGSQGPLGDLVVGLEKEVPIAKLESFAEEWPTATPRERGYRFLGYQLNERGQPTFRYRWEHVEVDDFVQPVSWESGRVALERQLKIQCRQPANGLVVRLARGRLRKESEDTFRLDDHITLRVGGGDFQIVRIGDSHELRCELPSPGEVIITERLAW